MRPEHQARQQIDDLLATCGWDVQDCNALNISIARGVAVREFPLLPGHGFADYLLYADGRAVGVVEAKREGHTLTGVERQSRGYAQGLPPQVPAVRRPLPFHYESTGVETHFTNRLDPEPRSREVFAFHRPEELVRLAQLEQQLRAGLRAVPPLNTDGLWDVQVEAIRNLERSLAGSRPKALIQMATGSGKTVTACSFCYRLIKFAGARRILFLVDRNNLGRQAILKRAFEGRLVPQDPDDEPASVLLERIRAEREASQQRSVAPRRRRLKQTTSEGMEMRDG